MIMNAWLCIFRTDCTEPSTTAAPSPHHHPSPPLPPQSLLFYLFCFIVLLGMMTRCWALTFSLRISFSQAPGPWPGTWKLGVLPTCPPCSTVRKAGHLSSWRIPKGLSWERATKFYCGEDIAEKKWWEGFLSHRHQRGRWPHKVPVKR